MDTAAGAVPNPRPPVGYGRASTQMYPARGNAPGIVRAPTHDLGAMAAPLASTLDTDANWRALESATCYNNGGDFERENSVMGAPFGEPCEPLDRAERSLQRLAANAYAAAADRVQPPLVPPNCQTSPLPAVLDTQWNEQFIGCPPMQLDAQCRMYHKDPRLWQADLNRNRYERGIALGAKWNPYKHMNARQSWLQFAAADWVSRKDSHMRPIQSFEDAYCVKATKRYGTTTCGSQKYPVGCDTMSINTQTI